MWRWEITPDAPVGAVRSVIAEDSIDAIQIFTEGGGHYNIIKLERKEVIPPEPCVPGLTVPIRLGIILLAVFLTSCHTQAYKVASAINVYYDQLDACRDVCRPCNATSIDQRCVMWSAKLDVAFDAAESTKLALARGGSVTPQIKRFKAKMKAVRKAEIHVE